MNAPERVRREWLARTGTDAADPTFGESTVGPARLRGWSLYALGVTRAGVPVTWSRFALHESGFAVEERRDRGERSLHVSGPAGERWRQSEGEALLQGDPRGRPRKMPDPEVYIGDYRRLRSMMGREPTSRDMAARYGVSMRTERRYRGRYFLRGFPPDHFWS